MYLSLQLPWSANPSQAESAYRAAGLVKTQGTMFLLPPDDNELVAAFEALPRPKSRMSAGAVALCKHFERGGSSAEHGIAHPYWPLPVGSNPNKDKIASSVLQKMLETVAWRNIMMLHKGVAVYELRNSLGYGMRWTLELDKARGRDNQDTAEPQDREPDDKQTESAGTVKKIIDEADEAYNIRKISFRGFLEPIEGLTIDAMEVYKSESQDEVVVDTQPAPGS